jgi:hypothetical protein
MRGKGGLTEALGGGRRVVAVGGRRAAASGGGRPSRFLGCGGFVAWSALGFPPAPL